MTPDDVAAIRAKADAVEYANGVRRFEVLALCDALEAARAERDDFRNESEHFEFHAKALRERAERAEAEWTAWQESYDNASAENDQLRAALARVQELDLSEAIYEWQWIVEQISAAIKGESP